MSANCDLPIRMRHVIVALLAWAWIGAPGLASGQTPSAPAWTQFSIRAALMEPQTGREVTCEGGMVKVFECRNVDLLAFLPLKMLGAPNENDAVGLAGIWGWTDPKTGREFALLGRRGGTAFVEVTDPVNPRYLGELPGPYTVGALDLKVYKNYALIVDWSLHSGVQIFDLTQLLAVQEKNAPVTFRETARYDRVNAARNIVIDTATGFAYAVGDERGRESCGGGLHMIDIRTPTRPVFAGCYAETFGGQRKRGFIHDAQCVIYQGPDRAYRGRELCFNAAEWALSIADVTNKRRPKLISFAGYPNVGYASQGWLSEDQRYFFLADEADEDGKRMTRTVVFDVSDVDRPAVAKEFGGTTTAVDHNLYVRGQYAYQTTYKAGLRVLDIRDPVNPKEVGYFDTTPNMPEGQYAGIGEGAWASYPYFRNGVVGISSMSEGLFLVRFKPEAVAP